MSTLTAEQTILNTQYQGITKDDLKAICKPLKAIGGAQALGFDSTNDFLINLYTDEIKKVTGELLVHFKTFKQWKEEGYKVMKGSKSFKVWSTPRKMVKDGQKLRPAKKDEDGKMIFYTASLFCNLQVTS